MNLKVFVVLCIVLVVMMMMEEAEGGCRRKCKVSCRVRCTYRRGRIRCKPHCGLRCKMSCGRRDEPELMADDESDPVALPSNFNDYDENRDGRISLDEFRNVVPSDDNEGFSTLDKDEDSFLNCEEFMKSNLDFDRQPSC